MIRHILNKRAHEKMTEGNPNPPRKNRKPKALLTDVWGYMIKDVLA